MLSLFLELSFSLFSLQISSLIYVLSVQAIVTWSAGCGFFDNFFLSSSHNYWIVSISFESLRSLSSSSIIFNRCSNLLLSQSTSWSLRSDWWNVVCMTKCTRFVGVRIPVKWWIRILLRLLNWSSSWRPEWCSSFISNITSSHDRRHARTGDSVWCSSVCNSWTF